MKLLLVYSWIKPKFLTQYLTKVFSKNHKKGFTTESIAMLESFLSNRKQCLKNGIEYSNWVAINHGVAQGTDLGTLIFYNIYQR